MTAPPAAHPPRPTWAISDVLDRTDLAALLDEHSTVTGAGHRRRWRCPVPDHHDHHASVTMFTDARGHERWRCWSGDETHRGDAIDLTMITHRLDRAAAIDHLASRAGLRADEPPPPPRRRPTPSAPTGPVPLHPDVVRYVTACEKVLWTSTGSPVREWLAARGFNEKVLRANHVGADPGRKLMRRPAGLPTGRSLAATFPALDPNGGVAYVQTRYLQPQLDGPKYENPAASLGSNPRLAWTLPVEDARSTAVRPAEPQVQAQAIGRLLVCEGIPDALTAAQHGLPAVAVLGAQAPDHRVADTLARVATHRGMEVVAVIDADDAGRNWGRRLGDLLADRNVSLRVIEPPDGLDLNSWALADTGWRRGIVPDRRPEAPTVDQRRIPSLEVDLP